MSEVQNAPAESAPVAAPVSQESTPAKPTGTPDYRALAAAYLASQPEAQQPASDAAPEVVTDDRPRDELGRFKAQEPVDGAPALESAPEGQLEAVAGAVEGAAAPVVEAVEPQPEPIKVSVRGRDGSDVEIEVTDPAVADLLRANHNDGMRREEFNRQMQTVNQYLAEKREFETRIEEAPEDVVLTYLPQEKQVNLVLSVIAQPGIWDSIAPTLVNLFQNETERLKLGFEAQTRLRDGRENFVRKTQAAKIAADVETATRALIPDGADEDTTEQFLNDALTDLKRAAQSGTPILPQSIPDLLAHRIRLYGFQPQADRSAAPPSPVPAKKPAIAAKAVAPAPTVDEAKQQQQAIKDQQAKIAAARAQAPAGAGAAPLKIPAVPKGLTVEQASAYVRKHMPAFTS